MSAAARSGARFGAPPGHARPAAPPGMYEAVVKKVTGIKALVRCVGLSDTLTYEADILEGIWTEGLRSRPETPNTAGAHNHSADLPFDGSHDHGPHDHRLGRDLKVGDRVVVAFLSGQPTRVVLVGRFP